MTWAVFTSFLGWVSVPLASAETNAWGNEAPIQNEAPAVDHSKTKKKKKKVATERNPAGERSKSVQPSAPTAVRPSQADKPVNESPEEDETRLTGNWGGARTKLSEIGLDFGLNYRADFVRLFKGGIAPQNAYLADIDFKTSFDFGKMVGWSGASAFFYMIHNHGSRPSEFVGDLQWTSNIQTFTAATKVYEAWFQQLAFDDKVSFLIGLHDLNSEFYATCKRQCLMLKLGIQIAQETLRFG